MYPEEHTQMSSIFPIRDKVSLDREPDPRLVDLDDETADEVFEALASSTTRKIFLELHNQPQTASDLAKVTDTSVQNVQYHLEKLSDVDLVEVVDTWYSERGSEMKVYAPQDESLVMFAGRDKQSAFRRLLDRFAGVFALLVPPSILAGWLANRRGTGVEEAISGEYAMAEDDDDATVAEDDVAAPDDDAVDTEAVHGEADTEAVEDDAPADETTETPVPEDTPAPEPEPTPAPDVEEDATDSTRTTEFDGDTVEVTVNDSTELANLTGPESETVYLAADGASQSDIMGIDPHVALAFFAGGLLVYGAFVLRSRVF